MLSALEESGFGTRAIVGTSMGAVVGAMYLVHGSASRSIELWREALDNDLIPSVSSLGSLPDAESREHPLIQIARRIRNRVVISFAMNRGSVLDDEDLGQAIEFLVPDVSIEDLPRKLVVVTTDLETGDEVRVTGGSLRTALRASSAIPGMVPAVEISGRKLVDGAVVAEVPVAAARDIGWPVVAVDVSLEVPPLRDDDLVLDTMMRAQSMTSRLLRKQQLRDASHVVRPEVGDARWAEWHRFDEFVELGRDAALRFLGLPGSPARARAPESASVPTPAEPQVERTGAGDGGTEEAGLAAGAGSPTDSKAAEDAVEH